MKKLMLCLIGVMFLLTGALAGSAPESVRVAMTMKNDTNKRFTFDYVQISRSNDQFFIWQNTAGVWIQPGETLVAPHDFALAQTPPGLTLMWEEIGGALRDYYGKQVCKEVSLLHSKNTLDIDVVSYNEKANAFVAEMVDQDGNMCSMAIKKDI